MQKLFLFLKSGLLLVVLFLVFSNQPVSAQVACPTANIQCGELDARGGCERPCERLVTSVGGRGPSWCACVEDTALPGSLACGATCVKTADCGLGCPYCRASGPRTGQTCQTSTTRDFFHDPRKVNEYVSWYLNGVINRAEYGSLNMSVQEDVNKLVSFSGPINRLMPLSYQQYMRIQTIESAMQEFIYGTTPTGTNENHDQIVVCFDRVGFSRTGVANVAKPCYPAAPAGGAEQPFFRLFNNETNPNFDWDPRKTNSEIVDRIVQVLTNFGFPVSDIWNKRIPPLPWEQDPYDPQIDGWGNPIPMTALKYRKYYNEWKGKWCITPTLFGTEVLYCYDLPSPFSMTNIYADLFPYVPLANNVDKSALHLAAPATMQPNAGTVAYYLQPPTHICSGGTFAEPCSTDGDNPDIVHEPVLYYPHALETLILSDALNEMFAPKEHPADENIPGSGYRDFEDNGCEIIETRTNPGDRLFQSSQDAINDDLAEYVDVRIDFVGCPAPPIDNWIDSCGCEPPDNCPTRHGCELISVCEDRNNDCLPCTPLNPNCSCVPDTSNDCTGPGSCLYPDMCQQYPPCNGYITFKIPTTPKIPFARDIWKSTVVGEESSFRRIFPKIEPGAPVECIADYPGETSTAYAPIPGLWYTPLVSVATPIATHYTPQREPGVTGSELLMPYQGTVYEYFLRAIQTALRPRGYGNPIPQGENCELCGELPELPEITDDFCEPRSPEATGADLSPAFLDIVGAAAQTFHVPGQLILGILYGEGAFNGGSYRGLGQAYSQTNVTNWASCEPLPQCDGPDSSIVQFIPGDWDGNSDPVLDELQELDPEIDDVDPCNLLHVIYVIANMLHGMAGGNTGEGGITGESCYGISMGSFDPPACGYWYINNVTDSIFETAIRAWEYGTWYDPTSHADLTCPVDGACNCATLTGGCAAGGFLGTACNVPDDGCEQEGGGSNTSHNACVWDVAHGQER